MTTLGTFHERRGEQSLLSDPELSPVWGRIFGQDAKMGWSGTVSPSFDGTLFGLQAGFDVFGRETASGGIDRAGLFVAYASMKGDVRGQALGCIERMLDFVAVHPAAMAMATQGFVPKIGAA